MDSVSIVAAARELYLARQYPGVVAACADALAELAPTDRGSIALRLLAARSLIALRRDVDAQVEIRACLNLEPQCGPAYRLLGELAARADELASAKIFLREALRLAPDDDEAREWLGIVENLGPRRAPTPRPTRPAAVRPPPPRVAAPVPAPRVAAPLPPPRGAALPLRPPTEHPAPRPLHARAGSPPLPIAPGFGQHLVDAGLLSPLQLKAALAYKRSTGVRLGAAAVALGFLSAPKVEWASLAYHGRHRAAGTGAEAR
ncbi:MAG: hypothetical protein IPL61_08640 [Myxococcales bacterium]|nr:hypothetical protein [Myxococcales bacterium]